MSSTPEPVRESPRVVDSTPPFSAAGREGTISGQSPAQKFLGELSVGGALTQFGRRLLDDFVNNNQKSSTDSNGYLRWLAGMVEGRYEKPDATSANGVVATVGAAAAAMITPGGARAKAVEEVEALAKAPIWSSTKAKSAVENAFGHWEKHATEFPELQNAKQYAESARSFVTNPPAGVLTKVKGGDTLMYDAATNTFGVRAANGAPRTMFRPQDGIDYWKRQ